jgi:flagellar biosynthesis regulator FlbT
MFADLGHFSQLSIKVMNSVTIVLSSVDNEISISLINFTFSLLEKHTLQPFPI